MSKTTLLALCAGIVVVFAAACAPKGGNLGRRLSTPVDVNPTHSPGMLPAR